MKGPNPNSKSGVYDWSEPDSDQERVGTGGILGERPALPLVLGFVPTAAKTPLVCTTRKCARCLPIRIEQKLPLPRYKRRKRSKRWQRHDLTMLVQEERRFNKGRRQGDQKLSRLRSMTGFEATKDARWIASRRRQRRCPQNKKEDRRSGDGLPYQAAVEGATKFAKKGDRRKLAKEVWIAGYNAFTGKWIHSIAECHEKDCCRPPDIVQQLLAVQWEGLLTITAPPHIHGDMRECERFLMSMGTTWHRLVRLMRSAGIMIGRFAGVIELCKDKTPHMHIATEIPPLQCALQLRKGKGENKDYHVWAQAGPLAEKMKDILTECGYGWVYTWERVRKTVFYLVKYLHKLCEWPEGMQALMKVHKRRMVFVSKGLKPAKPFTGWIMKRGDRFITQSWLENIAKKGELERWQRRLAVEYTASISLGGD